MNHSNPVLETYLSSAWGKQQFDDALQIIQEALDDGYVYTFSKMRHTVDIDGRKTFREGWKRDISPPTFYACLGSFLEPKETLFEMPTLISVEGEPKTKYALTVSSWSTWHAINLLFGEDAFIFSEGQLIVKDKKKIQDDINQWKMAFSYLNGTHMHYVLTTFYSVFELVRIENSTQEQVEDWINELETFGLDQRRWIKSSDTLPLLAFGLTGYSKALTERKKARVNFWRVWNLNRFDLRSYDLFSQPERDKKYA